MQCSPARQKRREGTYGLSGFDDSVLFIAGDGSLSYPDANGNIKAFRAYIKVK